MYINTRYACAPVLRLLWVQNINLVKSYNIFSSSIKHNTAITMGSKDYYEYGNDGRKDGLITSLIGNAMNSRRSNTYSDNSSNHNCSNYNPGNEDGFTGAVRGRILKARIGLLIGANDVDSRSQRGYADQRDHMDPRYYRDQGSYRDQRMYQKDYETRNNHSNHENYANQSYYGNQGGRGLMRRRSSNGLVGTLLDAGKQLIIERSQKPKANQDAIDRHNRFTGESRYDASNSYQTQSHFQTEGSYEGVKKFRDELEYDDSSHKYSASVYNEKGDHFGRGY